ncbi:MAG TPA: hypothetical protein VFM65_09825 [Flavobacteriaceae bacterium]|nr:hypothetical protein [Flavobacteriaceae bacterium]
MKNLLDQPVTDQEIIKKLIPQKFPFVMVDSLFYFDETTAVSGLTISRENILSTETHFSEAGIIENMAQSVALHGGYGAFLYADGKEEVKKGFLGAIKFLEIHELPPINSRIKTHIEVSHDIMGVKLSNISVKDETGKTIAVSTMKTVTVSD